MSSFNEILQKLFPFFMLGVSITIFLILLTWLFTIVLWGLGIGLVLALLAWIRQLFTIKRKKIEYQS